MLIEQSPSLKYRKTGQYMLFQIFGIILFCFLIGFDIRFLISPPLHSDDWTIISDYLFRNTNLLNLNDRRPLIALPYALLTFLLKQNLPLFYVANLIVILLSILLLFKTIREWLPQFEWMPILVSLMTLVYPIDFTKTWLIHIHARIVFLLSVLVIYLLTIYSKKGGIFNLILAHILLIVSMMIYEAGIGIIFLSVILLFYKTYSVSMKRSIALSTFLVSLVLFTIWRLILQPHFFSVQDNYLGQLTFSLPILIFRYLQALFIVVYNWVSPFFYHFGQTKYLIFSGIILVFASIIIAFIPKYLKFAKSQTEFAWLKRTKYFREFGKLFFIGFLFWVAGYIPTIGYSAPGFFGDDSRFSLFSSAGAALAFVALIGIIVTALVKSVDRTKYFVWVTIIPFIILASLYQIKSNNERYQAWEIQKDFWNRTFEVIPNLKDNSQIGIIISGYNNLQPFEIFPFLGTWEARSAVRVLYNNPTLNANYYYLDLPENDGGDVSMQTDWSSTVFLTHTSGNLSVELVDKTQAQLYLSRQLPGYDPFSRIITRSEYIEKYRKLVE